MGQCSTSIKAYDFKKISSEISNIKRRVCYLEANSGTPVTYTAGSVLFAAPDGTITDDGPAFTFDTSTVQLTINSITIGRGLSNDSQSIVIGNSAGTGLIAGSLYNTFMGYQAGKGVTTGDYNVYVGWNSGDANSGSGNYAGNVVVGAQTMRTLRGSNIVAIGNAAANAGGTNSSVFVGTLAGYLATTENRAAIDGNVGIGYASLYKVTETVANLGGNNNTAVGYNSGYAITSGKFNTLMGVGTGATGTCTGEGNTGIGLGSLLNLNANNYNTGLGYYSLSSLQTAAHQNIGVGYLAGSSITTGSYNVVIGSNNGAGIATLSNHILLADGQGNERLLIDNTGIFKITGGLIEYADDAAAAVGGIPVNGLYRTGSIIKIRVA